MQARPGPARPGPARKSRFRPILGCWRSSFAACRRDPCLFPGMVRGSATYWSTRRAP